MHQLCGDVLVFPIGALCSQLPCEAKCWNPSFYCPPPTLESGSTVTFAAPGNTQVDRHFQMPPIIRWILEPMENAIVAGLFRSSQVLVHSMSCFRRQIPRRTDDGGGELVVMFAIKPEILSASFKHLLFLPVDPFGLFVIAGADRNHGSQKITIFCRGGISILGGKSSWQWTRGYPANGL